MTELNLFQLLLDGGGVALIAYAFFTLLRSLIGSNDGKREYIETVLSRYIEDLKQINLDHEHRLDAQRAEHRDDIRDITQRFEVALAKNTHAIEALAVDVRLLKEVHVSKKHITRLEEEQARS